MGVVFVMVLVLAGVGAIYYAYVRVKVSDLQRDCTQRTVQLRERLERLGRPVVADDVRDLVAKMASEPGCQVNRDAIVVRVDGLRTNDDRLSQLERTALTTAAKLRNHRTPRWLIGFEADMTASYKFVTEYFHVAHYTWFDQLGNDDETRELVENVRRAPLDEDDNEIVDPEGMVR